MLIERDAELDVLNNLASLAASGQGQIALVRGEAGIGKTSLLRQFLSQSELHYQFYWGGCDALLTPRVLGPLHDMCSEFSPAVSEILHTDASITKLLPVVLDNLKSQSQPVVMVFEDTHWADNATLDFLKCLGRRIAALDALLIISYRHDETGPRHLLTNLIGEFPQANTVRIELSPISPQGTRQMAQKANRKISNLHEITNGNPFFITELLAANDTGNNRIPVSIKEAIGSRLNRLTPTEQNFLETLSVIPNTIRASLIDRLFPANADELLVSCVEKQLLKTDDNNLFRFRHELARLGTKSRTSSLWQKNTHTKITQALIEEDSEEHIEEITYHASAAKLSDLVLEYAPKAANIASRSGAHGEASSHLALALEFADKADPELKATLYESWSYETALVKIDDKAIAARHSALEIWRELERSDKIGENLRWLSRLYWYLGEANKANAYADEAISVLASTDASYQKAMAFSLKSQFYMLNGRNEEAILWGNKALEIEGKEGKHPEVRIHALNNVGSAMVFSDELAGLDLLHESLSMALKLDFHEHAARVYTNMADFAVGSRDFELAEKTISDGIVFDSNNDLDSWTHYLVGLLAQLRMKQGRLEEAETISEGVLELESQTLLMKLPALLVLARVQSRLGKPDAKETLDKALADALSTAEVQYFLPARLSLVEEAWLKGHHEKATEQLEELLSSDIQYTGTWREAELALWLHRYGIENKVMPIDKLPAPYRLELCGETEAAATEWQSIGSPYPAAMALLTATDNKDSARYTKQAINLLANMRAAGTLNKALLIAKQHGLECCGKSQKRVRRKPARLHPLGLTKKEQEIIPWVVKGLSNKEISERFSRSERTIENHIASIFRKLNVHSRLEALLRIQNEPWIVPESDNIGYNGDSNNYKNWQTEQVVA